MAAVHTVSSGGQHIAAPHRTPPESLQHFSPEEYKEAERRLVRKLDARLIAPLIIIYIMNYLDRNAIAAAKVAGIVPSLGLTDSEYQLSVSILFVGFVGSDLIK